MSLTTKYGCGIGDHYQKKYGMFVETSYLLRSVNIDYRLKQSILVKITGCFVTGSCHYQNFALCGPACRVVWARGEKNPRLPD
jgi:hypothetical protein